MRKLKLDSIDLRILKELQADGRLSFTDLAPKVGLTVSPCLERVRRLERAGVIRGYGAVLDPHAVNAGLLVFIELSLTYSSPDIFAEFKRAVRKLPQILECHLVSGDFEYLLKARLRDMNAYRELLGEIGERQPAVGLQLLQDPQVDRIQLEFPHLSRLRHRRSGSAGSDRETFRKISRVCKPLLAAIAKISREFRRSGASVGGCPSGTRVAGRSGQGS